MCIVILGSFLFSTSLWGQTAQNPQQGSNGSAAAPHAVTFQNGNLHSGNAHFLEGHSIPYQLVMTGLTPGNQYVIRIAMDALEGGAAAIDYVTSIHNLTPHGYFGHPVETINPLEGTGFTEATFGVNITTKALPPPLHSPPAMGTGDFFGGGTWTNLDVAKKSITVFGASAIGNITYDASAFSPALIGTGVTRAIYLNVPFTAGTANAVLAWGGHIASQLDYGLNTTAATEINGAPYHSRRGGFTNGDGTITYANEGADRSVQIDAIVVCVVTPGTIGGTQPICSGGDPLVLTNVTSGTATGTLTYQWQSNTTSCASSFTDIPGATGETYDPPAGLTTTTFYRRVTFSDGDCSDFSNCVTVTVNPIPNPPTVTPNSRCGPGIVALSAGGCTGTLTWYNASSGGSVVNTGTTFSPNLSGTTNYWVSCTVNGCESGRTMVTATVNPIPNPPTVTPNSRCGPGIVALSAGGCAGTLTWYDASSGGNVVNTGANYSPNLTGTTNFWVSCTVNGCESGRTMVTATVNPIPNPPTVTPNSRCGPGIVALSAGGCAGTLTWYNASSGGSVVNTGANYSPNLTGTTNFWVSCTVNGCESARTMVTATVNPIPNPPTVTPNSRCGPGIVALSAGGCAGTLTWYDASSGGNVVNTGANYSPNLTGTTNFWVSCTVNGCESGRTMVTATVNPIPNPPTVTPNSRCGPGIVALSAGGCAGTLTWYNASSGGSVVNTGANYSPNLTGTTNFWVSCTVNGCESARTMVTATVNPIPNPPTVTPNSRCGPGIVALSAGGCAGTLTWYNASSGGSVVNTGANYSPNLTGTTNFWVSCTVNGCESARTMVTATVNPIPNPPTVTPNSRCGPGIVALSAGGCAGTLTWYNASSGGSVVNTGANYSPNLTGTTNFWVSCTVNGCESSRTMVTATVNPNPTLVINTPSAVCAPNTVDLTAPAVTAGSNLQGGTLSYWTNAGATIPLASPNAVAVAGTYYIKVTTTPGCTDIEPVTVTIDICGDQICTYTQGAYGTEGGMMCNGQPAIPGPNQFNTFETITNSINSYTINSYTPPLSNIAPFVNQVLVVGKPGKSVYMNSTADHVNAIIEHLPGGGASKELDAANYAINALPASYLKNNRINNTLLAQTITLGLNLGIGPNLGSFQLQGGVLVTADADGLCGSNIPLVRTCVYNQLAPYNLIGVTNDYFYHSISAAVVTAIPGNPKTVKGLFELANRALANTDGEVGEENNVSLTAIAEAVDRINNAFDECRLFVGWDVPQCPQINPLAPPLTIAPRLGENIEVEEVAKMSVSAFPNPFTDKVKFIVDIPSSGKAALELYNTMGQKVGVVFSGTLNKGRGQVFEYNVPPVNRTNLFFVLRMNDQQVAGKLVNINR